MAAQRSLSESCRSSIATSVIVIAMIKVPVSLIIIGLAIYITIYIEAEMDLVEDSDTSAVPILIGVTGKQFFIFHIGLHLSLFNYM